MKKILFFEVNEFTGATRVTRTLLKEAKIHYEVAIALVGNQIIEDIESAIAVEKPDTLFSSFIKINPDVIKVGKAKDLEVIIRNDYKLADITEDIKRKVLETYPQANEIIVQTEEMRQELLQFIEIDSSKVRVMDNPLDKEDIITKAKAQNPFPNNGNYHFLWVGRKDPIKDIPTLEKAFEIVHKRYQNTDITFISDDPNPYRWMKYADCLVISSRSEASPNVLREALFIGTPVISTDCSPTVRQLLSPQNIVPVHDSKALAEAMIRMIELHDDSRILKQ